ncbi:hypothetical protein JD844_027403 [Phrynosoma platyrhinos]|uniref:Fatty acyl-CoA reductase n=1 Tax=Phrynosoma platyrhinos TaxID=52577 RepID=A0ABQ7SGB8_PHRPL|nr:hypothetical protein JD844_027403 [Phrynosoma platyrhinos]
MSEALFDILAILTAALQGLCFVFQLFDRVREEWPNFHEKIKPISAELTHPNLAITPDDITELLSEVNIVFHCAATVRFDEPLKHALLLNVRGTQQLLELAHRMQNLEAFIHISTAYANCNRRYAEEIVYPPPMEPRKLYDLVEWMDESLIQEITPRLIGDWPNTYTFTKALAEYLLQQEKGNLNVAIIRPSIVGASWREPFPGWIDNINHFNGFLIARNLEALFGWVQLASEVEAMQLSMKIAKQRHEVGRRKQRYQEAQSAHKQANGYIISTTDCPVKTFVLYYHTEPLVLSAYKRIPLEKAFRIPNGNMTSSYLMHQYSTIVSHTVPAFLYDLYLRLTGKKPR